MDTSPGHPPPPLVRGGGRSPLTPSPSRSLWRRVGSFCLDLLGIAGWTWLAIEVPLPVINEYLTVKNALVAFIAVVAVGRAIVDRIYDREG